MRLVSLSIIALSLVAVMAGCSSTTSDGGTAGSGNQVAAYTPKGNGKTIGEAEACKSLDDAIKAKGAALGCVLTFPTCPTYIQNAVPGNEACLQYDEGTITGCTSFYNSFDSCDDFANRPCLIGYFKGSAPKGCVADAGSDATPVESGTDAATTEDVQTTETSTEDVQTTETSTEDVQVTETSTEDVQAAETSTEDAEAQDAAAE